MLNPISQYFRFLLLNMRLIAFIIVVTFCLTNCKEEKHSKSIGEEIGTFQGADNAKELQANALEIVDFEGLSPRLKTDSDSTFVINFWATWCAPCIKELPHFEELAKNYSNQKVKIILVSLDFPNNYETKLKPYIKEKGLTNEVIALNDPDANNWIPKIDESWSGAIPATIIFNKDARRFYEQSFTYDELENQLKTVINN